MLNLFLNFKKSYKNVKPYRIFRKKTDNNSVEDSDEKLSETEINRESLAILASLGSTKEYLGEELSLGDIKKLKEADALKYYNKYQSVLGKQLHKGLINNFNIS